jgi:hypothetical protein
MEPSIQPTTHEELRCMSHAEFAQRLLAHGVVQVAFDYEERDHSMLITNSGVFDETGAEVSDQVPEFLRLSLAQRIEDNCMCHYQGRYNDCGVQQCTWDLLDERKPAG